MRSKPISLYLINCLRSGAVDDHAHYSSPRYDRAAQEWHLLGERVTAQTEFIPAATVDADASELRVVSFKQARKDIDAPFTQALEAAVAQAVP